MARMLEVLRRADMEEREPTTDADEEGAAAAPVQLQILDESESSEEMPFIEVGGRGTPMEASPEVLGSVRPTAPPGPSEARPAPDVFSASPPPADALAERGPRTVTFQPFHTGLAAPVPSFAPELIVYHQPEHPVSVQYRDLLRQIVPQIAEAHGTALLLTALTHGAGTTTALLNLAISAAKAEGRGVAVADVNWQHPDVATKLGLPPAPGLQEVLSGTASLEQALRPTAQERLYVLTAGEQPSNGPALGDTLRWVIGWLRQRFDLVFLDGSVWQDSAEMAVLIGASRNVLLVLGSEEANQPAVRAVSRALARLGGRLGGLLITG